MARLQNALTKQLTDEHERVDLKLREKEEEVRCENSFPKKQNLEGKDSND